MRQIRYCLNNALVSAVLTLVDHERKNDRDRELENNPVEVDNHGVAQGLPESRCPERPFKVAEKRISPFAGCDAIEQVVVFQRYDEPIHRYVSKPE